MNRAFGPCIVLMIAALAGMSSSAFATFHLMQIEQVIGGVNGDTTAQAIQLRMRAAGQGVLIQGRIRVADAAGLNPIVIQDFSTCPAVPASCVPNSGLGARILITSAGFNDNLNPAVAANFPMLNLIPASYLLAGTLTFESDGGTVYWRLCWGGAGYTGPTTCNIANDANANVAPPWPGVLPSSSLQALKFLGAASAMSTNNAADYALTPAAATFTNNANQSGVVIAPVVTGACCLGDGTCTDGVTVDACTGTAGTYQGDGTACASVECTQPCAPDIAPPGGGDGQVNVNDLLEVINAWGACSDPNNCPADIAPPGGDDQVNVNDLLEVINGWGACP